MLGLELGPGKIPLPTVTEMAGARGETGSAPGREGQWGVEERRGSWRDSKNIYRARLETAQGRACTDCSALNPQAQSRQLLNTG